MRRHFVGLAGAGLIAVNYWTKDRAPVNAAISSASPSTAQLTAAHSSFVELGGALRENRLGIGEPAGFTTIGARWLDLVFLPLVGFDRCGLRLGAGGGFYDRAFAFRQLRRVWHKPLLVGFGYAFQQVERLAAAPHDVFMDAVVTDEGMFQCTTG